MTAVRRVVLQEPMEHQIPVLMDQSRFKVLVCGRRWGKTQLLKTAALVGHGPEVDGLPMWRGALYGGNVWWILPTLRSTLSREIWEDVLTASRDAVLWKNETERRIHYPGGGSFTMKSSDDPETALRGPGLHLALMDELKDHQKKAWTECLRPTLSDKHGSAIFAGTPPRVINPDNLATHLFRFAENHEDWRRWQRPSSDNPMMTPEELASALEEVGSFVYAREYLAQFTVAGGGKFKPEHFRFYDRADGFYYLDRNRFLPTSFLRRFSTVDTAGTQKTYSDHSAIASWAIAPGGQLLLLEVVRGKWSGAEKLKQIRAAIARHALAEVFVETNAYATDLISIGKEGERPLPLRELVAHKDKLARAEPAMAFMEAGRVWLPRSAPWLEEWKGEVLSFEGSGNEQDDQVDTLSYAVQVARGYQPRSGPPLGGRGGRFPASGPPGLDVERPS